MYCHDKVILLYLEASIAIAESFDYAEKGSMGQAQPCAWEQNLKPVKFPKQTKAHTTWASKVETDSVPLIITTWMDRRIQCWP